MPSKISRRALVQSGLIAGSFIPVLGLLAHSASAAGLPPVDTNDPTAKALGFVTDSTKVDATKYAAHKATQKCGNCAQFQGKAGDATGGCNIFTGHSVPQGGWCSAYVPKPA
jgi:hypothetical protein